MDFTKQEKNDITNTWSIIRRNIDEFETKLFQRYFEANPSTVKYFQFAELTNWNQIYADPRYKDIAGKMMVALSKLVDSIYDHQLFEQTLVTIVNYHTPHHIEWHYFDQLRTTLLTLLTDMLGTLTMNSQCTDAWTKLANAITETYRKEAAKLK